MSGMASTGVCRSAHSPASSAPTASRPTSSGLPQAPGDQRADGHRSAVSSWPAWAPAPATGLAGPPPGRAGSAGPRSAPGCRAGSRRARRRARPRPAPTARDRGRPPAARARPRRAAKCPGCSSTYTMRRCPVSSTAVTGTASSSAGSAGPPRLPPRPAVIALRRRHLPQVHAAHRASARLRRQLTSGCIGQTQRPASGEIAPMPSRPQPACSVARANIPGRSRPPGLARLTRTRDRARRLVDHRVDEGHRAGEASRPAAPSTLDARRAGRWPPTAARTRRCRP